MAEKKSLTTEDFSNVWKDNNNTLSSGLKLDLVEHLLRHRLSEDWVAAKQRVINIMKLDQFDKNQEIKILDIGCGLGIDLMLVAEEATRLDRKVSLIGLDQNSTMIEEAKKYCENQKGQLSSNVTIEILRGDILQMEFKDETFDIVRSDITLQHVDLLKALTEIKRVLKVNGRLIALEGGAGNVYSSDETMIQTYDSVLPGRRDGATGIRLQFLLPKMNFHIKSSNPTAYLQSGQFLASQDKDWIKMKGMGEMLVTKGVLTEEESQEFQKRYIEACETNQVVAAGILFIFEAVKSE
jgi:ubiquinone/menaquinone biosynthesis C-methylase UbiE